MLGLNASAQSIHGRGGITLPPPPEAEVVPVTNNYFGTKVVDNYRWLEDASSAETKAFIDDENTYTGRYMDQARIRPQIADDLDGLEHVTSWTVPIQRGNDLFFEKVLGGEDQESIYVRHGWAEKDKRLIDPAQLSRDPDTSVDLADVSRDGALVAYEVREGGADETTVHVYNVKTGKTLFDVLPSGDYQSVMFTPDGKGLYYARMDKTGPLLYAHTLGTLAAHDKLLFGREFRGEELGPSDLITANLTDDYRYLVVEVDRGVPAKRVDIAYRDLTKPGSYFDILIWGVDSRFSAEYVKGAWYVLTDYNAPNGCVLKADPGIMPDVWAKVVPEGADAIDGFNVVGGKIFVNRMHGVRTETAVYTLEGKAAGSVEYDGIGSASMMAGRSTDRYGFFSFESVIAPPTIYRLDTATDKREVFAQPKVPFNTGDYELKQVFYTSKDGTKVPMFIAGKKGLKQDGTERLLMTGYGGFKVDELPEWNPVWAWWLEQGGWFAMPNLRGGGEYGEKWHEQGMFERKQNVFDDWFAAAEYLIANKYTSPAALRDQGPVEWRAAGGRVDHAEARTVFGGVVRVSTAGHAAVPEVRAGPALDDRVRIGGQGKAVSISVEVLAVSEREAGTEYPAVLFLTGVERHARRSVACAQDDGIAAGGFHERAAGAAALQHSPAATHRA